MKEESYLGEARGSFFMAVETWLKEAFKGEVCGMVMGSIH